MGADAAVHVQHGEEGSAGPEPLSVAKTFKAWMEKQKEGELLAFALTLSFFAFPFSLGFHRFKANESTLQWSSESTRCFSLWQIQILPSSLAPSRSNSSTV